MDKDTVVIYHDKCVDGFGAAYAAWKKLGDSADYLGVSRGDTPPVEECRGKTVYLVDFCFENMQPLFDLATHVCILDHHKSVEDEVKKAKEYVFDNNRSGSTIAWSYFHKETPVPLFLQHIEDGDLFRNGMQDTPALFTFLDVADKEFSLWDSYVAWFEDPNTRNRIMDKANSYQEYFVKLAAASVKRSKLVTFEGYTVYYANSHPLKEMKSYIGNQLVSSDHPFSLVVTAHPNGYGVSIRGNGSVDVSLIAGHYGGGGHHDSAGFLIPREGPFPWELIEEDENTSN